MWAWVRIPLLTNVFKYQKKRSLRSISAEKSEKSERFVALNSKIAYCSVSIVKWTFSWKSGLENRGIDPRTSRMLSERSTIWASSPDDLSSIEFGSTIPKNRLCKNVKNRQFLPAEIHKTPCFVRQGNQKAPFFSISPVVKTLSEVGFEPTPTFVDQNTLTNSAGKELSLSLAP